MAGNGELVAEIGKQLREYVAAWCAGDRGRELAVLEALVSMVEVAGGRASAQEAQSGEVARPELRAVLPLDRGTPAERRQRCRELARAYGWDPRMNCTPLGYVRAFLDG